jgi:hypothetical protein
LTGVVGVVSTLPGVVEMITDDRSYSTSSLLSSVDYH